MKWLRHAFAVESSQTLEVNDRQRVLVDRICSEVIRRRMTTPALLLLEMHRPFNYLSAQVLHFFQPILSILTDTAGYDEFARFLEQRGSIDYLIGRIESLEDGSSRPAGQPAAPKKLPGRLESEPHSRFDGPRRDEDD